MKITVVGTGYVGLVTGTILAEIGHYVTCLDVNKEKISLLQTKKSPIHEPGLDEFIVKNMEQSRLHFTTDVQKGFEDADFIFIAVGTPQAKTGEADLIYVRQVAKDIAKTIDHDVIVVIKSTVPVGTNHEVEKIIYHNLTNDVKVDIVSCPEFLREGHAVFDSFHGDRIVVGSDNQTAIERVADLFTNLNIPIFKTNSRSAEMIKYASNAFLATKISFINEIANLCEHLDADVQAVAEAMGMDQRIGRKFLNAGIGYGGSCFPKDTYALQYQAKSVGYDFQIIDSVIEANELQKIRFVNKVKKRLGFFADKKISILGLAFKPETDDTREAPSINIIQKLLEEGAIVTAFDPVVNNLSNITHCNLHYVSSVEEAISNSDAVLLLTEWNEFKSANWKELKEIARNPLIFDGRNFLDNIKMSENGWEYVGIGVKGSSVSILHQIEISYSSL